MIALQNPCPPRAAAAQALRLLLRPQEAADALGVSLRTLMLWVDSGQVPYCRLGERNLRFNLKSLQEWIDSKTVQPTAPVAAGREQSASSRGNTQGRADGDANWAANGGSEG